MVAGFFFIWNFFPCRDFILGVLYMLYSMCCSKNWYCCFPHIFKLGWSCLFRRPYSRKHSFLVQRVLLPTQISNKSYTVRWCISSVPILTWKWQNRSSPSFNFTFIFCPPDSSGMLQHFLDAWGVKLQGPPTFTGGGTALRRNK